MKGWKKEDSGHDEPRTRLFTREVGCGVSHFPTVPRIFEHQHVRYLTKALSTLSFDVVLYTLTTPVSVRRE